MPKPETRHTGGGWILLAALLFSTSGVGVKACHLSAWQIAGGRAFFASLTLWLILPAARRQLSWRLLPAALSIASAKLTYVWAAKETTAANAILMQSGAPLWVLLLSPLFLAEPIRKKDLFSLVICGFGLGLLCYAPQAATLLSPHIAAGNLIALISGVCWAGVILSLRHLRKDGAAAAAVAGNGLAAILAGLILLALPEARISGSAADWSVVLALGIVQNGLAYVCLIRGLITVPATRASILQLIEPVLNPIWAGLVFVTERPGPLTIAGGLLVLAGSLLPSVRRGASARGTPRYD